MSNKLFEKLSNLEAGLDETLGMFSSNKRGLFDVFRRKRGGTDETNNPKEKVRKRFEKREKRTYQSEDYGDRLKNLYEVKKEYRSIKFELVEEEQAEMLEGLKAQKEGLEKIMDRHQDDLNQMAKRQLQEEKDFLSRAKEEMKSGYAEQWQADNAQQQLTNNFRQMMERHHQEEQQIIQRQQEELRQTFEQFRQSWDRKTNDFQHDLRKVMEEQRRETENLFR